MPIERWDDERLNELAALVAADTQLMNESLPGLASLQTELAKSQLKLAQVVERLDEAIQELRAGQERHDRILDYLLRRDGERNNP